MATEATSEAAATQDTSTTVEATEAATATTTETAVEASTGEAAAAETADEGLAAAAAEHKAMLDGALKKPAANDKGEEDKEAKEDGKDEKGEDGAKPEDDAEKKEEPKPEAEKPAGKPAEEDAVAKTMARYIRSQEKAKAAEKEYKTKVAQLESDRKAIEAKAAEVERSAGVVRELAELVKTSPIDAIERLLGTEALVADESSIVGDLLERIQARRAGAPVRSQEQIIADAVKRGVQTELEAKQAAEKEQAKRAKEQEAAETQRNKEVFFAGLTEQYKIDHAKYPFLEGIDPDDEDAVDLPKVDRFMQGYWEANRRLPTSDEIFGHFNSLIERKSLARVEILERTGKLPKREPAPAPVPTGKRPLATAVPKTTVDSRGKPAAQQKPMTYEQKVEAMVAKLNAQRD